MATTTKTLAPTGTTVTLPDMTERPNASVLVDGIGKEADAINTLNSNMTNKLGVFSVVSLGTLAQSSSKTFTVGNYVRALFYVCSPSAAVSGLFGVVSTSTGAVTVIEFNINNGITVEKDGTQLTITNSSSSNNAYLYVLLFTINGISEVT